MTVPAALTQRLMALSRRYNDLPWGPAKRTLERELIEVRNWWRRYL